MHAAYLPRRLQPRHQFPDSTNHRHSTLLFTMQLLSANLWSFKSKVLLASRRLQAVSNFVVLMMTGDATIEQQLLEGCIGGASNCQPMKNGRLTYALHTRGFAFL